jgi:hypothetical protein
MDLRIQPASALTAAATEALDPSVLASALNLSPLALIGQVLTTGAIPDVGAILTSLIPDSAAVRR